MPDKTSGSHVVSSSFRDPSGFVFTHDGTVYRQINRSYDEAFDLLTSSGLYNELVQSGLLVTHEEADLRLAISDQASKVIRPERLPFISHPYEWAFSQLKDAALATMRIQKTALKFGMSLKDASAYNIQFVNSRPLLMDTLSFEVYREGQPWVAYRQFCQHFLAPLALMSHVDVRLGQLMRVYIDGIPLDLAARLLPFASRTRFPLLTHIRLHAQSQKHFGQKDIRSIKRTISRRAFLGLVDNLESAVSHLHWRPGRSTWGDYYDQTNYSDESMDYKGRLVKQFLKHANPAQVWDLGANVGWFSRMASRMGVFTVAFDLDPVAVERDYRQCVKDADTHLLPLVLDLANPSPDLGWENQERSSVFHRGPTDLIMALALVHHLAIANNLPLSRIAEFLARHCRWLIIEFVPKSDSQVQRLLSSREDIFTDYIQTEFESVFTALFRIREREGICGSERTLYLMEKR